jgi:hypothetical protein
MKPQFVSQLASLLARFIGLDCGDKVILPTETDNTPSSLAHFAPSAKPPVLTYVIAAETRNRKEWTVYNSPLNRRIAAGFTRNQAVTLAELLNLANPQRLTAQADVAPAHRAMKNRGK